MYPSSQAGYTRAILSLSLGLQSLAKWEETIYAGRPGHNGCRVSALILNMDAQNLSRGSGTIDKGISP